jgi:hypothetical protein
MIKAWFTVIWQDDGREGGGWWYVTRTAEDDKRLISHTEFMCKCKRWTAPMIEVRSAGANGEVRVDAKRMVFDTQFPGVVSFLNDFSAQRTVYREAA